MKMAVNTKSKQFIAVLPWALPLVILLPYAFFAEHFRVLIWVWENVYFPFWAGLGISLLGAMLSSYLIYRLNYWGKRFFDFTGALLVLHTSYMAMSERRHALLVMIFFIAVVLVLFGEKIKKVLALPYYDGKRKWWESYPKSLPKLHAVIYNDKKSKMADCRLANFGEEGCFIFLTMSEINFVPRFVEIKSEENILLSCPAFPAINTRDGLGWGLRFGESEPGVDWQKDLRDYLGYLRRSGYVEG